MGRWILAWLLLVGGLYALALVLSPDEGDIPLRGAPPQPALLTVENVSFQATADWPAWQAARAAPTDSGLPLQLGGTVTGLDLRQVSVEIGDGMQLRAERGSVWGDRVVLRELVRVEGADGRLLTAAAAEIRRRTVRFSGLVVFHRGAREQIEMDLALTLPELRERLR
ncbi:MAG: hypothetical protein ACYTGW_12030 [Planctomycetota bacterium]|jgi:hypothetical protein